MKNTPESTQHLENLNDWNATLGDNDSDPAAATPSWDILQSDNNNPFDVDSAPSPKMPESGDPFDIGSSAPAPAQPFTDEELTHDNPFSIDTAPDMGGASQGNKDNPFDTDDSEPARPFTKEELAQDSPFNIDAASVSAPEAQDGRDPFEV